MRDTRYEAIRSRTFRAPRALVWALVADTNRWDRASGLAPGSYDWRDIDGVWSRVAKSSEMGFALEWVEPPYRWLEGCFVHGERTFLKGPTRTGGFIARLEAADGGTEVVVTAYVDARGAIGRAVSLVMKARFGRALDHYLDAIGAVLARSTHDSSSTPEEGAGAPAVMAARRALMEGYDEVTSGHRTPCDVEVLARRAGRLGDMGVDREVAARIVAHLKDRPDEEVSQIRPFELARLWDLDRRAVLRGFLHATVAGITDLRWQINCPVCRVSAAVSSSLEDVREEVHCDACNIGYDLDFGKHVEAVFQSNPAIRPVQSAVYCASSPAFLPHAFAQLRIPRGGSLDEPFGAGISEIHLRTLVGKATADLDLTDLPAREREGLSLEVVITGGGLEVHTSSGGEPRLTVRNDTDREETVVFERAGWSADAVLGSVVASFPEFIDLFATEAPASGVELSIGNISLLFSDLTGSTALYQEIGDAKAFALVEEHFVLMDRIVREHGGALIKTMGDAVMASFATPAGAFAAALAMVPANDERFGEHGLAVRIGVHSGPCLAVRANDRLDFFGTTVNMAARLEGKAQPGQIVMTEEVAGNPDIVALIGDVPTTSFEAGLKGITATQKLVAVSPREA